MQKDLSAADIARLSTPVFRKHGVSRAGLFGSFARGEQRTQSDLDFLVEFHGRVSLFTIGQLKDELEHTFQRPCDVLTYTSVMRDAGAMAKKIQQEARPLYDER